jgi:hypothetical protein
MALAGVGKRTEALQSFSRALKIDPAHLAALEAASQLHYEAGSRRAVPLLERILRVRPDDATAHAKRRPASHAGLRGRALSSCA